MSPWLHSASPHPAVHTRSLGPSNSLFCGLSHAVAIAGEEKHSPTSLWLPLLCQETLQVAVAQLTRPGRGGEGAGSREEPCPRTA